MKKIIIITILIFFIVGAFWFFNQKKDGFSFADFQLGNVFKLKQEPQEGAVDIGDQIQTNVKIYNSSKYGFSFESEEELNITTFQEGEQGETILIRNSEFIIQGKEIWVQIFIMPWDEGETITPERIKKDLPALKIEDPQYVIITKNEIIGLVFFGEESFGKTREVWFAYNNYLYQVTTYAELDGFVGSLLETWKFEN